VAFFRGRKIVDEQKKRSCNYEKLLVQEKRVRKKTELQVVCLTCPGEPPLIIFLKNDLFRRRVSAKD